MTETNGREEAAQNAFAKKKLNLNDRKQRGTKMLLKSKQVRRPWLSLKHHTTLKKKTFF
jgi:hypothetical protein